MLGGVCSVDALDQYTLYLDQASQAVMSHMLEVGI